MSTDLYAYRPGLIFLSPNAGLQVVLWPERYYIYPDGSREMTQPVGFADFELGLPPPAEFVPEDEEGNPVTTSPVLGMETYGSMDNYLEIAKLADDLGLLEEALIYERRTKQRPGIIEAMEARRRDHVAE